MAEKVGILVDSYHIILSKNQKMHCISQHIPRLLMQEQCYDCLGISAEIMIRLSLKDHHR